jgi:hypothetical protein
MRCVIMLTVTRRWPAAWCPPSRRATSGSPGCRVSLAAPRPAPGRARPLARAQTTYICAANRLRHRTTDSAHIDGYDHGCCLGSVTLPNRSQGRAGRRGLVAALLCSVGPARAMTRPDPGESGGRDVLGEL